MIRGMDFYHNINSGRVFGLGAEIVTGRNMFNSRIVSICITFLWWEFTVGIELY